MTAADSEQPSRLRTTEVIRGEAQQELTERLREMDQLSVNAALGYALDAAQTMEDEYRLRQPLRDWQRGVLNRDPKYVNSPGLYEEEEKRIAAEIAERRLITDAELREKARDLAGLNLPDYDEASSLIRTYIDRFVPDVYDLRPRVLDGGPPPLGVAGERLLPFLERVRANLGQPSSGGQPAGSA